MAERCRVVICDDHQSYRELVSLVLGLEPDLEVVGEAADGRQAIEVARRLEPDAVLLDVSMPEMDGIEALPHIRAAAPGARVIMVTAFGAESVRRRATEAGAHAFVEKGGDIEDLVAEVRIACGER
jgi:two-component system, NarL family, response regulator DesR